MSVRAPSIHDTHDLRQFMQSLKDWASNDGEDSIVDLVQRAESRGMSASELLIEYIVCLKSLKSEFAHRLPEPFRSQLDRGIAVAEDAVNLGSYTYKSSTT